MPGLNDRWASRDYPVLEWIVQQFDASDRPGITSDSIASQLGISPDEAFAAAQNLYRGGYLVDVTMWAGGCMIGDITERALRETGLWPNEEAIADSLLWFLEQKIEQATTADERGRWAKIRDGFAGAGRDVAVEFAAAMATRSLGG
jgi:hypothetical protein